MNSIKQEARVNLIKMVQAFIDRKTGDWSHIMVWIEKYIDRSYSQGVADERARVLGIVISKADEAQEKQFEIAYHLRAIASEIERSEAL